jgi:predicted permease
MRILREWLLRLAGTLRPSRSDDDIQAELRSHLDFEAARGSAAGSSGRSAARAAVLRAGHLDQAVEAVWDQQGLPWLSDFARDLRYGCRTLARDRTFSLVAILSIALGIGATTAMLSLVDTVTWRTLPVRNPRDLVFLDAVGTSGGGGAPPYPCFERFRRETTAFAGMAAFATDELPVSVDGVAEQVRGQVASGNYFDLLGVAPELGRLITEADERDPGVAVIGYGYWQRRFGGDPGVLGRTIVFRQRPHTIIGVASRRFLGLQPGRPVDLTLPITIEPGNMSNADGWWFRAIARLAPGATRDRATAQVDQVFQSYMKDRDTSGLRSRFFARMQATPAARGLDGLRLRFGRPLSGLALVAAFVLLIACANLGSLLIVRGAARERELAIRLATGAGAGRLFRQLLTETTLLFAIGAALGLALAPWGIATLTSFFAVGRNPIELDVRLDARLTALAVAISGIAALATGLWPAARAVRSAVHQAMREGESRTTSSRRLAATTRILVVVQVAIACLLVTTALIFTRTMANLEAVDLGFTGRHVLTMSIDPMLEKGEGAEARPALWKSVLERVRTQPGVGAASLSVLTPLSGRDTSRRLDVEGIMARDPADRLVRVNHVSEDYFRTFGIEIQRGRAFTAQDMAAAPRVVIVNESAARMHFGGRDPIGARVRFDNRDPYTVIGIAGNARHLSVREPAARFAYVPIWQPANGLSRLTLSIASSLPAAALTEQAAREVRAARPQALVSDVVRVEDQIGATLVSERLLSMLASGFGTLALLLASIGVYGVLSSSVDRRRTELAIRSALGAAPATLASSVIRQVAAELAIGAGLGLGLSLVAARLSEGLLFGVQPGDPRQYVVAIGLLAAVAAVAAVAPIRRAWSIDPVETLRRS